MVCGLEIPLAVLGCVTAIATLLTATSEGLPFIKKISGNGILHTLYHLLNKKKLNDCVNIDENKIIV
tara:strand:+ start:1152 stop:1352 length:201 start_codon:yes stop_codon:yes gene_type:complete